MFTLEGNCFVDKLATYGRQVNSLVWWNFVPYCLAESYTDNKLGLPEFRLC